jgi:ribosome-binding protein aMBF1 (putative translation factor)
MRKPTTVSIEGRDYVILARDDYERLAGLAKVGSMPALPAANAHGTFDAAEYARASIARDIVRERVKLGLTQRDFAKLAKVRVETLCRIETGRHTASTATIAKLDRALKHAAKAATRKGA